MKIINLSGQLATTVPCVATIGFFDGVHKGHQYIINKVISTAQHCHLAAVAITFAQHPRQVLQCDWHPQLLTTFDEKMALLSQTGIDGLAVLPFDREMAALTAHDFMAEVLKRQLGVHVLVTGYDNHFGHRMPGSQEGFDDYVGYGREIGMQVLSGDPFDAGDVRVSSSKVRQQVLQGDVSLAASCLGRPYMLTGKVVRGKHIGTGLGFPTANLLPDDAEKLIPANGVYAVRAAIDGEHPVMGMMNIGSRPTFAGDHLTLEVHLFHFAGDLYGRRLSVSFIRRLRSEVKFDSGEALQAQLVEDARQAEKVLNETTKI